MNEDMIPAFDEALGSETCESTGHGLKGSYILHHGFSLR